jgi:signal transduction histidine kinase
MGAQFSIRYKFLAVTMLLLAVCVGTYLLLASYIFKEDKRGLVFDYNRSLVVNLSSDLDNFFKSLADKMRLVAYFQSKDEKSFQALLKNLLEQNPDLVWVGYSDNFKDISREYFKNSTYQKTYGLEEGFFTDSLLKARPIPFSEIQRDGEAIWSATIEADGPALIGYGKNVIEENEKGVPTRQFIVVAYVRADRIIASLKESRPNESLVVSTRGDILAAADSNILQSQKMQDPVLFERAKELKVRAQVLKYDSTDGARFGAFSKAAGGHILVLSSISEKTAFKAVNDLVTRSLLFGSILITFAFILAIYFSRSLTRPIETLVGGMKQVSDGDLNTNIEITSRDEIASLAHHFNLMIGELKKSRSELEEINRELENKVKERTLQLEQRNVAVKEAQEALLRSTRLAAVGEVAGLAAHEVLNPLTSIIAKLNDLKSRLQTEKRGEVQFLLDLKKSWEKDVADGGFAQLVKAWQAPSPVLSGSSLWQEDLSNIDKVSHNVLTEFDNLITDSEFLIEESQRINRIIQSFRGMSSMKNEMKEQSVHKLSDRSITIMADLAAKHNISIKKNYTHLSDSVWLDEDEFIQAMTNLLRNAIQSVHATHASDKLGEIEVTTDHVARDGQGFIAVHVRDNGGGMTDENALKLFNQKFTTKSKAQGTGIGLSLSRRLVRAFKGDIKLTWNAEGQGAQFTIEIPLAAQIEKVSA